ncbi:MAG: 16S rRNA (cytosine(967)-C(5))-methyltransferase RsmB [Candidatus Krumholzibacteria bacterium]|jgi:16S rRNA (cytosine967-C5)-methyltransferase|nr:16S rRNA (cytosine(967)-C(5))-methyltransferase RsmB [Candidatus Krumholzibacteria bacterium]MDP6796817.1 16S rRNA (cytosine(967)-C(5))-methyltransferase RsmB [Candidatus Krumholzibacteria bacterium]MDP7021067.1 16S rRNA (cytosine(967)-C(5))-methyltransferase RsmB [Candidatus Krumholzibacteria bacterium]
MKIAPVRRAALEFLREDRWLHAPDWDRFQERILDEFPLEDSRDRRLFTHLVSGSVRLKQRLDARLRRLTGRKKFDSAVLASLRLALYQLEESDRLPPHAIVHDAVEWVKQTGNQRLAAWVNAQLRNYLREGLPGRDPDPERSPLNYAVDVLSYPRWLARRWIGELGRERAHRVMDSMNGRSGITFRWNRRREGLEEFLRSLEEEGQNFLRPASSPFAFRCLGAVTPRVWEALEDGKLSVQDEAAQRVAPLLASAGGEIWADLCAAPGGKTGHLAELAMEEQRLIALDRSEVRMEKVLANLKRLGFSEVECLSEDLLEREPILSDGVLLDAPCSALGVLAENPDARWRKSEAQIVELVELQSRLLDRASQWLRPGGRLVYSVCTLSPEETRLQIEAFLERHPDFQLDAEEPGFLLWPDETGGSGSYAACFRRTHG